MSRRRSEVAAIALGVAVSIAGAAAADPSRLVAAYPDHIAGIEGNALVWRDGTRTRIDDGKGRKPHDAWLADPDLKDIFRHAYPAGDLAAPPQPESDPGRARPSAIYERMYGDCRKGEVERNLVEIVWLPRKANQRLKVTRVNGVAERLRAVSEELDRLPAAFDVFLVPSAGTYNCRVVAGTTRTSAHGWGAAIDIAVKRAHYWQWAAKAAGTGGAVVYRNEIPAEIVRIFERHGFIWGGKWHHYDTMHFEYRPELLAPPAAPR